jgi:nucleotide-binding universal stress UspA family protein
MQAIVVGIDESREAARAAALAAHLAETARTSCYLIHALDEAPPPSTPELLRSPEAGHEASAFARARERMLGALWGLVPPEQLEQMLIRPGRPAVALREAAEEFDAGLIVIGAKRHHLLSELAGRSTARGLSHSIETPVLMVQGTALPRRILVAVDHSAAAPPVIEVGQRYAQLLRAELHVISVVEPLPVIPGLPAASVDPLAYFVESKREIQRDIASLAHTAAIKIRFGDPVEGILQYASQWPADLVIAGTHGAGWIERVMLGSVADRLLHAVHSSLMLVPVQSALEGAEETEAMALAGG